MTKPAVVLAIGGFDGSGGAGTLADARAIQLNGGYPCAIVTAITAQNTTRIDQIEPVSADSIRRQLICLADDFQIDAVKIGLLPNVECVETLIEYLSVGVVNSPIVIDPVMRATSGGQLADQGAIDALLHGLAPLATLVTPNIEEANKLTNKSISDLSDAIAAGSQLVRMGCQNVLVKGGHLGVDKGTDTWCYPGGHETFEPSVREDGTVRGTGCMLSSAIACHLAHGRSLREAILSSKRFVAAMISERHKLGQGTPLSTAGIKVFEP